MQNDGGRPCTSLSTSGGGLVLALLERRGLGAGASAGSRSGRVFVDELADAVAHHAAGVFAGHRQHVLAVHPGLDVGAAQDGVDRLLDVVGLAFLDDQDGLLAGAEADELLVDQRIGDVHHVERHLAVAERVGEAVQHQRADRGVVEAALQHDADVVGLAVEELVEPVLLDDTSPPAGQRCSHLSFSWT